MAVVEMKEAQPLSAQVIFRWSTTANSTGHAVFVYPQPDLNGHYTAAPLFGNVCNMKRSRHCESRYDYPMEKLCDRNISLTTRLVDTVTTPMLLKIVRSGKLQPGKLVTHRFAMNDIMKAYDTFGNAAKEDALKVVLTNGGPR